MWERLKTVTPDTWARSVCLLVALINQVLAMVGKNILPFAENDIYQFVSIVATIVTSIVAWWKNNSFTKNAQKADKYMKALKDKAVDSNADEDAVVEEIIEEFTADNK